VTERQRTSDVESELVRQAAAGDRSAQERLLEHYHGFIRATLVQLTFGRADDLEELMQQALLGVARGLPRFAHESSPMTWVRGVCANVVKDHLRRRRRRARFEERQRAFGEGDFVEPLGALEARDLLRALGEALDTLSPTQRTAFVLRIVYGHGVDEVARMMKATRTTTRARLYFARRKLAQRLQGPLAHEELREPDGEVKAI
jgi:RNA polymerase sigma-70 factor (ECF subfamily)